MIKQNFLVWFFSIFLVIVSCDQSSSFSITDIKQLSFEGDNGEAYFNHDNSKLIFQSKRGDTECDKLYLIDINGESLIPFSLTDGAFTCAYYSLNDAYIFFSSTMQDGSE